MTFWADDLEVQWIARWESPPPLTSATRASRRTDWAVRQEVKQFWRVEVPSTDDQADRSFLGRRFTKWFGQRRIVVVDPTVGTEIKRRAEVSVQPDEVVSSRVFVRVPTLPLAIKEN